jgi:protein-tyrosine kinase
MSRIHDALKRAGQETDGLVEGVGRIAERAQSGLEAAAAIAAPQNIDPLERCTPGNWNPDHNTMLFFQPTPGSPGDEQFRTLRSRLYQLRQHQPLKKLLVTSPMPKEGKTMVAANLAQVIARQHGRRTLLMDADLRCSHLHIPLGANPLPGLSEYLRGTCDEFAIIQQGPLPGLFFIPGGQSDGQPLELLHNGRLRTLLTRLEPLFDWVILDSPPALPVSDASLIATHCDGVLVVVRAAFTDFDVARRLRQEFEEKQLLGVILNGVSESLSYGTYFEDTARLNGNSNRGSGV